MVNAVAPEPQKSLESAQLTPAEAKRIKKIEDLVQPWKQKLTDHHIYDVSSSYLWRFHDPDRSWKPKISYSYDHDRNILKI